MEMPRGLRRKDGKEVFQGRLERVCFDPRSWVGPSRDRWGSRINVTFSKLCLLWVGTAVVTSCRLQRRVGLCSRPGGNFT
jgi:hypothetical protein